MANQQQDPSPVSGMGKISHHSSSNSNDHDEIEFLVQQTLKLTKRLKELGPEEHESKTQPNELDRKRFKFSDLDPKGPGILYKVKFGISTYSISMRPVEDLQNQIEPSSKEDSFHLFPLKEFSLSEKLSNHFSQTRYPIYEEKLCNLSDPGLSWWGEQRSEDSFRIYFQHRYQAQNSGKLIKLGPLGDAKEVMASLSSYGHKNAEQGVFKEWACTDQFFSVQASSKSKQEFLALSDIFFWGQWPEHKLLEHLDPSLAQGLNEVALRRRFWRSIQDLVAAHLKELKEMEN